ncbi:hypothetical protein [Epilithonimonas hungarica]|uniref:DoxX family protein n=1 Tax=Epilithonimonas hungarica TaxID=454006 RepID=A0A1G7HQD9_9FLAO|nr:hypothetical protein [Epilithonimonas hungarica]MDP9956434.1 hypothetical protein [Epilithonimonas hungarica]SDF02229.1 hypothetical protein SAMN05421825_0861 [Epilithonimonas hungarica]
MKAADKSFNNNKDHYIIFGLIILVYLLSINTDLAELSQHRIINIPSGFFYYTLGVDILVVISWILILFYKKLGVILFPVFVMVHFGLHNYFLSTYLYSDITVLFLYVGLGLLAIIPRWNYMK